jgi:hypothetical protein
MTAQQTSNSTSSLHYRDRASAFALVTLIVFTCALFKIVCTSFTFTNIDKSLERQLQLLLLGAKVCVVVNYLRLFGSLTLIETSEAIFKTFIEPLRWDSKLLTFFLRGFDFALRLTAVFFLIGYLASEVNQPKCPSSLFGQFAFAFSPLVIWDLLILLNCKSKTPAVELGLRFWFLAIGDAVSLICALIPYWLLMKLDSNNVIWAGIALFVDVVILVTCASLDFFWLNRADYKRVRVNLLKSFVE